MYNEGKRVVYAGDWHDNIRWALSAIKAAHDYGADTIVHVGDFGFNFPDDHLDRMQLALAEYDIFLYFVDGNHENFERLYSFPIDENHGTRPLRAHIHHLPRGFRWTWNDTTYLALGGAYSVDYGAPHRILGFGWWPDERITYNEALQAGYGGEADVMITHDCPTGVDIPGLTKTSGYFPADNIKQSDAHRDLLRSVVDEVKPKLLVHGHYHTRYNGILIGEDYETKIVGLAPDGDDFGNLAKSDTWIEDADTEA